MSEIRDRVAKAIAKVFASEEGESWDVFSYQFYEATDAAFRAMREPTEAMTDAAASALKVHIATLPAAVRHRAKQPGGIIFIGPRHKHTIRWRAMIDAALASPQSTQGGAVSQDSGHSTSKL